MILINSLPFSQFIHGLAFFVLGMAIVFVLPRAERPDFVRRLPLLAVLAFCEAAVAWDSVLSCALRTPHVIPPLFQTALLGIGYACLLAFGLLAPHPPSEQSQARSILLSAIFSLWILGMLIALLAGAATAQVLFWAEIAARYGLALPGGLLTMGSMRRQTYRNMDRHTLELITTSRRIAGAALGAFGLLAGLLVPSATLLLTEHSVALQPGMVTAITSLLLAVCAIASTYGLTYTLNVIQRQVERWIEEIEQNQALVTERERIGRELHDGIIQSIYAAGLMLESVRQVIPEDPTAAQAQLSRVMVNLNQTIQDIRRYIFDLRSGVPEGELVSGLEELLRDFRVNTLVEARLIVEGEKGRPLLVERRRHIFQIVREGLTNVARHAHARHVEVRLIHRPEELELQIADDGIGLTIIPTATGQGLRNIRERTRLLEGALDIDSVPGQGVKLTLTVPYSQGEGL